MLFILLCLQERLDGLGGENKCKCNVMCLWFSDAAKVTDLYGTNLECSFPIMLVPSCATVKSARQYSCYITVKVS